MSCPVHVGDHGPMFAYSPCGKPARYEVVAPGDTFMACPECAYVAWVNGCSVPELEASAEAEEAAQ